MAASFDYAVVYTVNAICRTPLRTGDADGEVDQILRYKDKTPFIQGNSISGAFRGWLEKNVGEEVAGELFGSQEKEGYLIISDGVFARDAKISDRPGIVIDKHTGTAKQGGKFDTKHIDVGAEMKFSVIWTGWKQDAEQANLAEEMLSAMNEGEIRLGAKKTNGMGTFKLQVHRRSFDLRKEADRKAWLDESDEGASIELKKLPRKIYTEFVLSGRLDSILVKAAIATRSEKDEGRCIENMKEGNVAIIPGSSVKGAVRARVEAIADLMGVSSELVTDMFGNEAADNQTQKAGKLYFEDVFMDPENEGKSITRIRINKFTGGVIRGGLFQEKPLSAEVQIRIRVPDEPAYCMLILYALRDLGAGLYNLGSGGAIGRGYFKVASVEVTDSKNEKIKLTFNEAGNCKCVDESRKIAKWSQGLEAYR